MFLLHHVALHDHRRWRGVALALHDVVVRDKYQCNIPEPEVTGDAMVCFLCIERPLFRIAGVDSLLARQWQITMAMAATIK